MFSATGSLVNEELLKKVSVGSMAELEAKLLEAARSLDEGGGVDGDAAFVRLRRRAKARRRNR
jgi:hypothetical protein